MWRGLLGGGFGSRLAWVVLTCGWSRFVIGSVASVDYVERCGSGVILVEKIGCRGVIVVDDGCCVKCRKKYDEGEDMLKHFNRCSGPKKSPVVRASLASKPAASKPVVSKPVASKPVARASSSNDFRFDSAGFDSGGFDSKGFDRDGFDRYGFDVEGYDRDGYYGDGFNQEGYNRDGFDRRGYDREGYDREGYSPEGYHRFEDGLDAGKSGDFIEEYFELKRDGILRDDDPAYDHPFGLPWRDD